jgi:hypothetical protein
VSTALLLDTCIALVGKDWSITEPDHFSFGLVYFLVRVRSCDFVDRSVLSAKQTIHEITRSTTKWDSENDQMKNVK